MPAEIISKAYVFNAEYAWRPEDIGKIAQIFGQRNVAVLGGEVWLRTAEGPLFTSNIYQWSSEKKNTESKHAFVQRSISDMVKFYESISAESELIKRWADVYINLEILADV